MTDRRRPGSLRRLAAISYDLLILGAVLIAATALTLLFSQGKAIAAGTWWYQLYIALIVTAYFAGFWRYGGQTIGMVAWRLRVVSTTGKPLSLMQAVWRAVIAPLSWLAAGLGYWWILFDTDRRAWHDRLSRSDLELIGSINARAPAPPG